MNCNQLLFCKSCQEKIVKKCFVQPKKIQKKKKRNLKALIHLNIFVIMKKETKRNINRLKDNLTIYSTNNIVFDL